MKLCVFRVNRFYLVGSYLTVNVIVYHENGSKSAGSYAAAFFNGELAVVGAFAGTDTEFTAYFIKHSL